MSVQTGQARSRASTRGRYSELQRCPCASFAVTVAAAPDRWRALVVSFAVGLGVALAVGWRCRVGSMRKRLRNVEMTPVYYVAGDGDRRGSPEILVGTYLLALVTALLNGESPAEGIAAAAGLAVGVEALAGTGERRVIEEWEREHGPLLTPKRISRWRLHRPPLYVEA